MFSRGRPCLKRCRGLSTAVLDHVAAATEEAPLLFLYPRWFTSMLRQPRASRSISTVNRAVVPANRASSRAAPRKQSFGASSRRWISGGSAVIGKAHTDGLSCSGQQQRGGSTIVKGEGETGGGTVTGEGARLSRDAVDDEYSWTPGSKNRTLSMGARGDTDKNDREGTAPVRRPRKVGKARSAVKQLPVRERRKLRNRLYWTRYTHEFGGGTPWGHGVREMLEILQRETGREGQNRKWRDYHLVDEEESRQKEILVPEETVALLAGVSKWTMEENIWYVPVRNGCRVHVLPPGESEGQNRKVILTGTEWAIGLVTERIQQTQDLQQRGDPLVDIRKPVVPVFPSLLALSRKGVTPPLVRGVWDFHSSRRAARVDLILNNTKRVATVREFTEYVEELVNSLPASQRDRGKKPVSHQKQVAGILLALLKDDKNQSLLSTAALNLVLSFLLDCGFLKYVYRLVARTENVATVDTFNLLLKSTAMKQDIRSFRRVLRMMSRLGIRPNPHTWLAYLDCLVSPRAKEGLMKYMEHKGFLKEASVMRSALQLTIQDSFMEHLKRGGTVDDFFNKIAKTAGANWFPPSLLGQMFSVTARLENVPAMARLLQICRQHGLALESSTTSMVRQIAPLFRSDIYSLLHYVFLGMNDPSPRLTKEAYERLFLTAFKGHHYNICRVLWRYACMNGAVTYPMKDAVIFSLIQNVGQRGRSEWDNQWRTGAGKVIAGIDLHLPEYPSPKSILKDIPPEFHAHPISFLVTGARVSGEERSRQIRVARAIVERDMTIGTWYRPSYSLATMLDAAATVDVEWEGIPRPTKWLMQNAVQVPVQLADSL